jgi:hypothetical protein
MEARSVERDCKEVIVAVVSRNDYTRDWSVIAGTYVRVIGSEEWWCMVGKWKRRVQSDGWMTREMEDGPRNTVPP